MNSTKHKSMKLLTVLTSDFEFISTSQFLFLFLGQTETGKTKNTVEEMEFYHARKILSQSRMSNLSVNSFCFNNYLEKLLTDGWAFLCYVFIPFQPSDVK